MPTTIRIFLLCAVLLLFHRAHSEMLIAGIDLSRVVGLHPEAQRTLNELISERNQIRKELAQEFEKYQKLVEEARSLEQQFLSPAISESRRRELQAQGAKIIQKVREEGIRLQKFRDERIQKFGQKFQEESRRILELIRGRIQEISHQKGATLVLNTSGRSRANATVVQYLSPTLDITADVLKSFGIDPQAEVPETALRLEDADNEQQPVAPENP